MKDKENVVGFPREFAIHTPLMSEEEQLLLKEQENKFKTGDSLVELRNFLVDLIPTISFPSKILFYSLGKILYSVSDYDTLISFSKQYSADGLAVWNIRVLIERGLNDEAVKLASEIRAKEDIPILLKLHTTRSIAYAYLNIGNYEQCKIYLNELFEESFTSQKLPDEEKHIVNDVLLEGHRDNFYLYRYVEEKIKLENKLNVALHIAEELAERNHIARFYYLIALLQRDDGKLSESLEYSNKAIEILKTTGNRSLLAAVQGNLGTLNVLNGDLKTADKIFREILETFSDLEENKYIALSIKSLGDIAIARGDFDEAIEQYEEALKIIEKLNLKETYQYCILAELYLQKEKFNEFEILLKSLEEEVRSNPSPTIEAYIHFIKGLFNIKKLNYGQAEIFFKSALKIADKQGRGELSAKILMNLILLEIARFDVEKDKTTLDSALIFLEQLLPFFVQNKILKEHVALHLLQGKIYAVKGNYTNAFNSLQHAKDLLDDVKNKELSMLVEKKIAEINAYFLEQKEDPSWTVEPFRNEISNLEEIGLRFMQKSHIEEDQTPMALIILHRSGIPLRSYVILKRAVKDQLLFGGFITAVKDMLSELFEEQRSQMMVITYGNHKIVIEAHPKGFSSVAISAFDSFSLRRKIHQLTENLAKLEIPKQFYGEISEKLSKIIDDEVKTLFGTTLIFSDAIKLDI